MEDYKLRVIDEYAELKTKISKLNTFLQRAEERDPLLAKQLDCMYKYSDVLKERMQTWE